MFSTSLLFSQRRVRNARMAAVIVLVACTFSVHAAVIDPQLTISVRAYSPFDRMHVDLDTARAQVEAAFRPTGIAIEWIDCHSQSAPAHCESPPQADEVVVRIIMATESH